MSTLKSPDLSSCDDIINAYTRNKYCLFRCLQTGKGPKPPKNWQNTLYDPLLLSKDLGDTYGVCLQKDDLILDVDPRRYKNGVNELDALWKTLKLKDSFTFVVHTGGGGFHLYFKKPVALELANRVPGFNAIEIKTAGQFVIGAGSLHKTGSIYEIARGDLASVENAPKALLAYCEKTKDFTSDDGEDQELIDHGSIRRFIQFCLNTTPATEYEAGNNRTYRVACEGRDMGLNKDIVYRIMYDNFNPRCIPPWNDNELEIIVKDAFDYAKGKQGSKHPRTAFAEVPIKHNENVDPLDILLKEPNEVVDVKKTIPATFGNALAQFQRPHLSIEGHPKRENPLYKLLGYNEFSQTIEFIRQARWHDIYKKEWQDTDLNHIKKFLARARVFEISTGILAEAALAAAQEQTFNPLIDYLESLKWDGEDRITEFLHIYAGTSQTIYTEQVGKATLIGAVKRVYEPGCQHDYMLILEGEQGTGKTQFVRILGGEYYLDSPIDLKNIKDTVHALQTGWIIEAAEMEFLSKYEVKTLRAFLTRTTDNVRLAYGRAVSKLPRHNIFIGTINPDGSGEYLNDPTGHRRFWPVATTVINLKKLQKDRDQIWAQAVQYYKDGQTNQLSERAIDLAIQEQEKRSHKDPWGPIIETWINRTKKMQPDCLSSEYILNSGLNIPLSRIDKLAVNRISNAMRQIGYKRMQKRKGNERMNCWVKIHEDI